MGHREARDVLRLGSDVSLVVSARCPRTTARSGRYARGSTHGTGIGHVAVRAGARRCPGGLRAPDRPASRVRDPIRPADPARAGRRRGRRAGGMAIGRSPYNRWVLEIALTIVGGLILLVLTYFVGVRRGKRYREEDRVAAAEHDADHRIDRVVQRYTLRVRINQTGALHGLLVAGVKNLRSSDEIRLARERATAQTGNDPLRQYSLDGVDLKEFVDACDFDNVSIRNDRELLARYGKPPDA